MNRLAALKISFTQCVKLPSKSWTLCYLPLIARWRGLLVTPRAKNSDRASPLLRRLQPMQTALLMLASQRRVAARSDARKRNCTLILAAAAAAAALPAVSTRAADILKADNADDLNLGTSWVGGTAPGTEDVGVWDSTVTTANSTALSAAASIGGIRIANPGGLVTVGAV